MAMKKNEKTKSSRVLLDEYPLVVLPTLAKTIGLNEALVLQQIHFYLSSEKVHIYEDKKWVYNSYSKWQKQFPFWSVDTIKRIILKLEKEGYIESKNFNKMKMDRTKWYTINYEKLNATLVSDQADPVNGSSCPHQENNTPPTRGQDDPTNRASCPNQEGKMTPPIPETPPKTSSKTSSEKKEREELRSSDSEVKLHCLSSEEKENCNQEKNSCNQKKKSNQKNNNSIEKTKNTEFVSLAKNEKKKETKDKWTPEKIKKYWNETFRDTSIPTIQNITGSRLRKLEIRLREPAFDIERIVKKILSSSFLKGENDHGWRLTFDWVISNDNNYVKILEGQYDGRYKKKTRKELREPSPYEAFVGGVREI